MKGAAAAAGVTLSISVEEPVPAISGDWRRTLQILSNLLANAIKATPRGGAVTLRAWAEGDEVHITVEDTGIGIPPDQLRHLFDRFWQGVPGRRGSVGLGLAIARGLVEAQGGRIEASSEPGRGSIFSFTLPAAEPASATASPQSAAQP
jgi:signal transduction histidine kinase